LFFNSSFAFEDSFVVISFRPVSTIFFTISEVPEFFPLAP
jgi:hypothetical protein